MNKQEIHNSAQSCKNAIDDLLRSVGNSAPNLYDGISVRGVEQIQDRFRQWADNLGAFHKPESPLSLEQRLRDNHVAKDTVLKLLSDLHESITTGKKSRGHGTTYMLTEITSKRHCQWETREQNCSDIADH